MNRSRSAPVSRAQALAAWRQVEEASAKMERLLTMGGTDTSQVARLLELGATPRRATPVWFNRIVAEDNLPMARALIPVFIEMSDSDKAFVLRQVADKGSEDMMGLMLDQAFMRQSESAMFMALIVAVEADRVGMARILLEAGCPTTHPLPQEAGDSYHRLGARLKSVDMLDLILAHGWQPDTADLFDALAGRQIGNTDDAAPRAGIVERLLAMGVPASSASCTGKPWSILMRTPNKHLDFHDEQLACARLLRQAQVPVDTRAISLPAMLVMLEAGVSAREAMELWKQSSREPVKGSDFFAQGDTHASSMDKWMHKARDVLLAIDRNGLPLEQLKQARAPNREFTYALAAAGCHMDSNELAGVPDTYLKWREEAILDRHTASAMGGPRAPRL